jgi:type IV pilus assembly protein PilE
MLPPTIPAPTAAQPQHGFTLIEMMIAVAVIGIVLAVALPSYESAMRKSRRGEAFAALAEVQQRQERRRSSFAAYASSVTNAPNAAPPGLQMPSARTNKGLYDLAITLVGGGTTGYVASAVGVAGTPQEKDGPCRALAVRFEGGNVRYGGAATLAGIDWTLADADPNRCWAR